MILLEDFPELTWKVVALAGVDLVAAGTSPTYTIKLKTYSGEPHKIDSKKFWDSGNYFRSGYFSIG